MKWALVFLNFLSLDPSRAPGRAPLLLLTNTLVLQHRLGCRKQDLSGQAPACRSVASAGSERLLAMGIRSVISLSNPPVVCTVDTLHLCSPEFVLLVPNHLTLIPGRGRHCKCSSQTRVSQNGQQGRVSVIRYSQFPYNLFLVLTLTAHSICVAPWDD